jgi:L1 cell adhesion molecule like protein
MQFSAKDHHVAGEMIDIMTHLHQYVPTVSTSQEHVISTGETVHEESATLHPIIVGGDQLTAARARSAIKSKTNAHTHSQMLSGLVPAAEDWHTKANFLGVSNATINLRSYQCYKLP